MKKYKIEDICRLLEVNENTIFDFIQNQWLNISSPETNEFDQEDITRARLILELIETFEVNEEAVPIILHLVDQLHQLRIETNTRR